MGKVISHTNTPLVRSVVKITMTLALSVCIDKISESSPLGI
jgi:hypothetical protein